MANLRFMMKFSDQALGFTERHYVYNPLPGAGAPISSVLTQGALQLMQARSALCGTGVTLTGGVFSYDDSQRDALPVAYVPLNPIPTVTQAADPEMCIVVQGTSLGIPQPNLSYEEQFYLAGVQQTWIGDQGYGTASQAAIVAALSPYFNILLGKTGGITWGWAAVNKAPTPTPIVAASISLLVGAPPGAVDITMATAITATPGTIVKVKGVKQVAPNNVKLNGRWIVVAVVGDVLTVVRKNSVAGVIPGYLGGGLLYVNNLIIVPFTALTAKGVGRHNRGGTLGLQRGRRTTRLSNV
jgi:hypothetical protein